LMGNPRQRMPIGFIKRSECPANRIPVETAAHVQIVSDVTIVVIVDEGMSADWVIERKRRHHQKQAEHEVALLGRRKQSLRCSRLNQRFSSSGRQYKNLTTEVLNGTGQ